MDETVTVSVNGRELELYVCDTSDAREEACIRLAEITQWCAWISRVRERFFPEPEGREMRLETVELSAHALLMRYGLGGDAAMAAAREVRNLLNSQLPAASDEPAPETPGPTTMERLARATEYRFAAFRTLISELIVDEAVKEDLNEILADCREDGVMFQIIATVMGGGQG